MVSSLVSVIITTKNSEGTLKACLEIILLKAFIFIKINF